MSRRGASRAQTLQSRAIAGALSFALLALYLPLSPFVKARLTSSEESECCAAGDTECRDVQAVAGQGCGAPCTSERSDTQSCSPGSGCDPCCPDGCTNCHLPCCGGPPVAWVPSVSIAPSAIAVVTAAEIDRSLPPAVPHRIFRPPRFPYLPSYLCVSA